MRWLTSWRSWRSEIVDAPWDEQYLRCHAFYEAVDGRIKDWAMQEYMDPITLKRFCMWRKKS